MSRLRALLTKELSDLRRNPTVLLPAILVGIASLFLPFFVGVVIPAATGERLSDSSDFQVALELYRNMPSAQALDPEAAVQAWIFQQFLILLVLVQRGRGGGQCDGGQSRAE